MATSAQNPERPHEPMGSMLGRSALRTKWSHRTTSPVGVSHELAARWWPRLLLAAILLGSAGLCLWNLDRVGFGNAYYAAAVRSMLQSWHGFFFTSFDPGGFVTVDKPPLGFWIQVLSARLLGFSGVSILLPEVLATVGSVALLYHLVRRAAGITAGLLAALALALTPVAVVVGRNNTIDALLVGILLLAVWAAFIATERGSLRWLALAAVVVGLGFAIKMLQAYLVVPAMVLLYLVAAPRRLLVRLAHLSVAGVALLTVSFAWPLAVDLTPADQRPYVGSTQHNSAVELALGYNGLQRLLGAGGRELSLFGLTVPTLGTRPPPDAPPTGSRPTPYAPLLPGGPPGVGSLPAGPARPFDGPPGGAPDGPGGSGENGPPGALRLLNQQLAGQASWLLPLALLGLLVSGHTAWAQRRALGSSRCGQAFFLWGAWLLGAAAFFSVAGFYHRYYLVMLGPPVAALAAIGVVGAWRGYRADARMAWLLPLALVATAALQADILSDYPEWARWLTPIVFSGAAAAATALLAVRLWMVVGARRARPVHHALHFAMLGAAVGTLALLLAPAVWSAWSVAHAGPGGLLVAAGPPPVVLGWPGGGAAPLGLPPGPPRVPPPEAGVWGAPPRLPPGALPPGPRTAPGELREARGDRRAGERVADAWLIDYLQAHRGDARFLVATMNASSAAPIIIATGEPVMALGGFSGNDPILTAQQLQARVEAGEVRFFLLPGVGLASGPGGRPDLTGWIRSGCPVVAVLGLEPDAARPVEQLYDCSGVQGDQVPGLATR